MIQKRLKRSEKNDKIVGCFGGNYWKIWDISLFGSDRVGVLKLLEGKIVSGRKRYWIATVNPEFVMEAQKDRSFKELLKKTDLNVVDGIGLVWANQLDLRYKILDASKKNKISKFFVAFNVGLEVLRGKYKNEVASGADLMLELTRMAKEKNKKIFLLGGWENRAEKTAEFLKKKYKLRDNQIGWCQGEPKFGNEEVIKKINKFKPDVLLVAYGMKRQEFWIRDNLEKMEIGIVMGVGRSFDYYSGELKRAPEGLRKMGMEWLYSLIKEPKRLKRQLVLPKFVWNVLREN